jgi:hypothetical protein
MRTFNFELDRKVTMWCREYHEVEANTIEEAEEIMKANVREGNTDATFVYQDVLDDTMIDTDEFDLLNKETGATIYSDKNLKNDKFTKNADAI